MPFTENPPAFTWNNLNATWATLYDTWLGEFTPYVQVILGTPTPFAFNWANLQDEWDEIGTAWANVLDPSLINPPADTASTDVTADSFGMSTGRGRNRDLQRTNAGSIDVQFRNETRRFDPQSDSPIKDFVKPRVPVRMKVDGFEAFTGTINDWDLSYAVSGQSTANLVGADSFTLFAQESAVGTAVAEASGARLNRVLDGFPIPFPEDEREIDAGNATFHAQIYDSNALQYLQNIEQSEGGLIFMTKGGKVAFQQRLLQPAENVLQFTDGGDGIPYEDVQITFGTDLLANSVTVTSTEGTAIANNTDSQEANGVAELSVDSLLESGSLEGLANFLLFKFGTPEYRFANVTVNLRRLSLEERADVLQLELGSQADVIFTPNNVGDPISIRNRIIGISHDVTVDEHRVTFNFEALGFSFFILDDPVAGKLDNTEYVLGF